MKTINQAIDKMVDKALASSKTYRGALGYLDQRCDFSELGQAIKKAAQDKVRKRALGNTIL